MALYFITWSNSDGESMDAFTRADDETQACQFWVDWVNAMMDPLGEGSVVVTKLSINRSPDILAPRIFEVAEEDFSDSYGVLDWESFPVTYVTIEVDD